MAWASKNCVLLPKPNESETMALALEQACWPPLAMLSRKQGPAKNSLQAGSHSRETFCIRLKKKKNPGNSLQIEELVLENSWFPDALRQEQSRAVFHDQW